MNKFIASIEAYSASVLRYGMAAVILWFSIQQFMNPTDWVGFVPDFIVSFTRLSATTLVYANAAFEAVFGLLLVFGWQTRIVALLLALHLFDIMWTVGYGQVAARDFGLAVATLVISMHGPDALCVQQQKTTAPGSSGSAPTPSVQPKKYV